ncbi:MAG: hypothetical protein R3C02_04830 [Planctomycetaceae bacterium]
MLTHGLGAAPTISSTVSPFNTSGACQQHGGLVSLHFLMIASTAACISSGRGQPAQGDCEVQGIANYRLHRYLRIKNVRYVETVRGPLARRVLTGTVSNHT